MKDDALEQVRELAKIDDSYILVDSVQTPGYISQRTNSYLYAALEIAWRVSPDPEVVKGVAPVTRHSLPVKG